MPVSDEPQDMCLRWTLQRNVRAGTRLRVIGNRLRAIVGGSRVDALTISLADRVLEPPVTDRYSKEAHRRNWGLFVREPYLVAE